MTKTKSIFKINFLLVIFFYIFSTPLRADVIKDIDIKGNDRISSETIKMFAGVSKNDDLSENDLNKILKDLYNTNFFDLVSVKINNKILLIEVKENPIIQNINYEGIKSSSILEDLKKNVSLKPRSSFNKIILTNDKKRILSFLKDLGYYFSQLEILIEELEDNKVNLTYKVTLGKKAKIKKISFIGDNGQDSNTMMLDVPPPNGDGLRIVNGFDNNPCDFWDQLGYNWNYK